VKFLAIPNMQKGIRNEQQGGEFSLQIKGNFSWGFVEKNNVNINECITLKDIDICAKKGEIVCLIGQVGCGKSSLLNAIGGNLIFIPD